MCYSAAHTLCEGLSETLQSLHELCHSANHILYDGLNPKKLTSQNAHFIMVPRRPDPTSRIFDFPFSHVSGYQNVFKEVQDGSTVNMEMAHERTLLHVRAIHRSTIINNPKNPKSRRSTKPRELLSWQGVLLCCYKVCCKKVKCFYCDF